MTGKFFQAIAHRFAIALICSALILPVSAAAQKIIGTVKGFEHLENPVWVEAKDPKQKGYSFREMVPTVPAKYRKLFPHIPKEMCLVALAEEPQKAQLPTLVRVGGGRTTPVTIVVTPGTKLVFENTDPFKHRLYIPGDSKFPPSDTQKGGKREWTAAAAGTFEIRDELAPSLRMWVVAEPNVSSIAYPSIKGAFKLTVAEPGNYVVQAYFAGEKVGPAVPTIVGAGDVAIKKPLVVGEAKKESKKGGQE